MADATTAADSTPASWYTITGFIDKVETLINANIATAASGVANIITPVVGAGF